MINLYKEFGNAGGGGGASGLVVHGITEGDTQYLDKTYAEIMGSIENGIIPVFSVSVGGGQTEYAFMVTSVEAENTYAVALMKYSLVTESWTPLPFMATSADGVLTLTQQ